MALLADAALEGAEGVVADGPGVTPNTCCTLSAMLDMRSARLGACAKEWSEKRGVRVRSE